MSAKTTAARARRRPERGEAPDGGASEQRLPLSRKLAYGVGELVVGIRQSSMNLVLFPFYTDVALLSPGLVGLALALGKVWDGVNDPIVGYLSDQTRSRHGRRRPFLLVASIPLAVAFAALWRPPFGLSPGMLFAYLFGALFFLDIFFGFYATPFLALGAEMSTDYDERTRVVAVRAIFHNLGLFLGGGLLLGLVEPLGGGAVGHGRGGAILAALMAASGLIAFFGTREPEVPARTHAPSLAQFLAGLRDTLRLESFRTLLLAFSFLLVGASLNQSFAVYVFRDAMGAREQQAAVLTLYLLAATASFPLWAATAARLGKNRTFQICLGWSIASLCLSPLMGPTRPLGLTLGFVALAGMGVGGYVLPVAIVADVFDEDELRTGKRREGAYFGVWTLVMKVSSGLGVGLAGLILPRLGYVAGGVQSPETLTALKLAWGPGAAVFFLATLIAFRRFPITPERHREIRAKLEARRAGAG